jgi:hypothetical protein
MAAQLAADQYIPLQFLALALVSEKLFRTDLSLPLTSEGVTRLIQ